VFAGLAVFLALTLPWPIAVVVRQGADAPMQMWLHQAFGRAVRTTRINYGPPWFYLGSVAGLLLPWTLLLPAAIADGWRRGNDDRDLRRLLFWWTVPTLVVFSISAAKESEYILPIYPAFCIAIGLTLARLTEQRLPARAARLARWGLIGQAALGAAAACALPVMVAHVQPEGGLPWLLFWPAALSAAGVVVCVRDRRLGAFPIAAAVFIVVGWIGYAHVQGHRMNARRSPRAFCAAVAQRIAPGEAVIAYKYARSTFSFHLKRPVRPVHTSEEIAAALSGGRPVVCMVRDNALPELAEGLSSARIEVLHRGLIGRRTFLWLRLRRGQASGSGPGSSVAAGRSDAP
jgi:4-amino-4-deoxy-L-arabinose transferase-like glycosyltransferase